ncbi:reverse transcriptase domain, Reverse transcriptase zinc-binding domain protein [Artemisia annua]|uniref:Reverse transcriptase domain, Reverse transcriptase zinc-binding domain protein n=1 Tax=Artemisia annua TaxID=35608 RepID=A0A2U1P3P4_ARTAN|nr:reverse transcriptase domain, Reverse transcriptase zinc-binding domain protein [Artemisia annua]
MKCLLCMVENETHSHLFFNCAYSRRLWERLKPMALLNSISNNWASIISGVTNRPAVNKIWSVIQRLVFGASIYFVWQERNMRYHQHKVREVDVLFDLIVETVRMKVRGLNLKSTNDVIKASGIWNFPISKNVKYQDTVKELNGLNFFNDDHS